MMSATQGSGLLVLNPKVDIVRVREFPLDIRQRLGGHSSDFIVSHHNSRVPSRRIEEDAAMLQKAPHTLPISRPDEVKAAKEPVLRWTAR